MSEQETGKPEGEQLNQDGQQQTQGERNAGQPEPRKAEDQPGESATPNGEDAAETERRNGVQKRISKLVQQREEERRRNQELEERLRRLEADREAPKPQQAPTPEQFENYDDYLVAKAVHEIELKGQAERKADEEKRQKEQAQKSQQQVAKEWAAKVADAMEVYQDFEEVALGTQYPISDQMARFIATHEKGADIAYYLGSHPDEADRLAEMDPLMASAELGVIAAGLERPKPKKATTAPDPVEPVAGASGPEKPLGDLSYEEYKARRMAD